MQFNDNFKYYIKFELIELDMFAIHFKFSYKLYKYIYAYAFNGILYFISEHKKNKKHGTEYSLFGHIGSNIIQPTNTYSILPCLYDNLNKFCYMREGECDKYVKCSNNRYYNGCVYGIYKYYKNNILLRPFNKCVI